MECRDADKCLDGPRMNRRSIVESRSVEFGTKALPQLEPDRSRSKTGLGRSYRASKEIYPCPEVSSCRTFSTRPGKTPRQPAGLPGFRPVGLGAANFMRLPS